MTNAYLRQHVENRVNRSRYLDLASYLADLALTCAESEAEFESLISISDASYAFYEANGGFAGLR